MPTLSQTFPSHQTVTVHALRAGTFTLPAAHFLSPCPPSLRLPKPSLSFLLIHTSPTGHLTRLLFDLGIRHPISEYPRPIQNHLLTRQPLSVEPDVCASLAKGGLGPQDVDVVVLSHVHWDHIGRPADFGRAVFVVGHGTLGLLRGGGGEGEGGSHSFFERDLLPVNRTVELGSAVCGEAAVAGENDGGDEVLGLEGKKWEALLHLPAAIDVFGDQSVFIVDAPGHLDGHVNLLARTGLDSWVYLAGDACHDRSLLTGEADIAEWTDVHGRTCCIHKDKEAARRTLRWIRELETLYGGEVEVVLAHDDGWCDKAENRGRFWPGKM